MIRDGWYVKKIHGSKYQSGLPDVYAHHLKFGGLWIELKHDKNKLEDSQVHEFALMSKHGARIFVIRDVKEYPEVLYHAPNWGTYGSSQKHALVTPLGCVPPGVTHRRFK